MQKVTITLDDEILKFVDRQAQGNRSTYINALLAQYRQRVLVEEMIAALSEDAEDADYQAEIAVWDGVAGDGVDAEGEFNL